MHSRTSTLRIVSLLTEAGREIRLFGNLDALTCADFEVLAEHELTGDECVSLRIDANGVTTIDREGVRAIYAVLCEAQRQGVTHAVVEARGRVRRVLEQGLERAGASPPS